MHEPLFIIRANDRDAEGRLRPEQLEQIVRVLKAPGLVLLPSDTSYSIAAWLDTAEIRDKINLVLERSDDPISLAFPSMDLVRQWTEPNRIAEGLLKRFTPGPITVVCRASRLIPDEVTEEAWRSQNRTLGVRIPNSIEEQQVALAGRIPVTTVAVRDVRGDGTAVTTFAKAIELVQAGVDRIGGVPWCAIEGEIDSSGRTSTVIEVLEEDGNHRIVRENGPISPDELRACIAELLQEAAEG